MAHNFWEVLPGINVLADPVPRPTTSFHRFLDLPRELRDVIYDLYYDHFYYDETAFDRLRKAVRTVLGNPVRALGNAPTNRNKNGRTKCIVVSAIEAKHAGPMPLSSVCKQIRTESLDRQIRNRIVHLKVASHADIRVIESWLNTGVGRLIHRARLVRLSLRHCAAHADLDEDMRTIRRCDVYSLPRNADGSGRAARALPSRQACYVCSSVWDIEAPRLGLNIADDWGGSGFRHCTRQEHHRLEIGYLSNLRQALQTDNEKERKIAFQVALPCLLNLYKNITRSGEGLAVRRGPRSRLR